jgi:hypothetical protein
MGIQVTISANQIDKERLGYQAISLSAMFTSGEPSILAGSKVEVGGALYEFTADEAGTGWAGITSSTYGYMQLVPSGATIAWNVTNTAPTWDTAKQGWYNGSNRAFACFYKVGAGTYSAKVFLVGVKALGDGTNNCLGKLWHFPQYNTTSRQIVSGAPPAVSNWSSSILGAGVNGIPTGIKAVFAHVHAWIYATAAGLADLDIRFSDNDANTPTTTTGHPSLQAFAIAAAAGFVMKTTIEMVIPLNNLGRFYYYSLVATNVTVASSIVYIAGLGWYYGE